LYGRQRSRKDVSNLAKNSLPLRWGRARVGVDEMMTLGPPLPFIPSHGGEGRFLEGLCLVNYGPLSKSVFEKYNRQKEKKNRERAARVNNRKQGTGLLPIILTYLSLSPIAFCL
jgi:hypothetical protein